MSSWRSRITEGLAAVDARIEREVAATTGAEGLDYIGSSGGKRMRPALAMLAAQLVGADPEQVVAPAAGVEFIHVATLVHDDVIDESLTRRGRPSLVASRGVGTAIVVGDYYLTAGISLLNESGDSALVARGCQAVMRICSGELSHVTLSDTREVAEAGYFRKVEAKTAELLRVAALAGTVGVPDVRWRGALDEFSRCMGIAFQLIDDLFDYSSDAAALGKPVGADFAAGTVTLPLIRAFHQDGGGATELRKAVSANDVQAVVQLVGGSSAMASVRQAAQRYADEAKHALDVFDDGDAKSALFEYCDYVIERQV